MSWNPAAWTSAGQAWLESFLLTPWYLWFLLLIPVVILLYMLKLKRTQVIISSTLLWVKSLQDLTANAPFQKLRKNLLMFLQIIILIALVAALARPFVKAEGAAGRSLCLLIDRSASMQTMEGEEKTRLDLAKEQALRLVDEMEKGDKVMLVTFAENADVLSELTEDRVRLRQLIRGITPSDSRTKLRDAMLVAHSLRLSVEDLHVIIISDGRIEDLEDLDTREYEVTYLSVGSSRDNAGIVAFSVRTPMAGETSAEQSFVLVHNESTQPLTAPLTLYFNDQTLTVDEVNAEPGGTAERVFEHNDLGEGVLRAVLEHPDALAADNEAWLALRPAAMIKTLLITDPAAPSSYFLNRVLAPDTRVELSAIAPKDYVPTDEYDLTIFNNALPDAGLPGQGAMLFINTLPPDLGVTETGVLENPPVIGYEADHPMMRFLNPSNVAIRKARQLALPEGARPLVFTTGAPLIADVSRGGQQIVVVTFDIADSDWPLRLSFPLFFQNLLSWVPRASLASESSVPAGRPLTIMPSPDVESVTLTRPDGVQATVPLDPLRPVFYGDTEQRGVYRLTRNGAEEAYAVNILSRTESSIAPAESLHIGRVEVAAQRGTVKQTKELWRWLVAAALVVLAAEWWVYTRRAWI